MLNINFSNVRTIFKREMKAFFDSPMAYIVMVSFLAITGWFFASTIFLINYATMEGYLDNLPLIFIFFVPAVTMRLLSEEYKSGTIEILSTMPVADIEIILGKLFSGFAVMAVSVLLTLVYPVSLFTISRPHLGTIFGAYLGLLLVALFYVSIGVFSSAMTKNQIVAFLTSFIICFFFFMAGKVTQVMPGYIAPVLDYIGIDSHFGNITRGLIDSRDVVYYLSGTAFFTVFALKMLSTRK